MLEGSKEILGEDHLDELSSLALMLQRQGKYKAAEEMHQRVLEGREKVLGGEHPDTPASVHNQIGRAHV